MSITPNLKHWIIYIVCWFVMVVLIGLSISYTVVTHG